MPGRSEHKHRGQECAAPLDPQEMCVARKAAHLAVGGRLAAWPEVSPCVSQSQAWSPALLLVHLFSAVFPYVS